MTFTGQPEINTRLWLGLAVVAALLCQPAGIAAVIFVALAMKAENIGDWNDAIAKLRTAKQWTVVGIVVGLPATVLYVMFVVSDAFA